MPTSPRVKRSRSSSSDPPASKRTKGTDGPDISALCALRGVTIMQAITGSGAPTRVELSVPTAGTATLKVYEYIRDVKAWMAHGTNAQDYAHDSRKVFCKYGCGESWTGKSRHVERRVHEAEICMRIVNRGTDEDWLQRKLDDAIRVPLEDCIVKNRFVDVDGVERCQFVVTEGLRVRCDLCDLVLPGADPVGDNPDTRPLLTCRKCGAFSTRHPPARSNHEKKCLGSAEANAAKLTPWEREKERRRNDPRADREWLGRKIKQAKEHAGQYARTYLEQRKHLSLLNPGDSNSDDEITDEAPSRPDDKHVFGSHLVALGLPFNTSGLFSNRPGHQKKQKRTVLSRCRGDRDRRKKKVLPRKLYDILHKITVIKDPAILEYRRRFADQNFELPKDLVTFLPNLEGASLEEGTARQTLWKDEQQSFDDVMNKWSAAPWDDDMFRRVAFLCAFQLLAVLAPGTGLLHPDLAKMTFDLRRGDVALVASFLETMSGPKLHARVAGHGSKKVLADDKQATCLGCNRSFNYGGGRTERIACHKPRSGGCGQYFAMLDGLITFRPGQIVKVPTEAFGEEWAAEDHPGKTYRGKLLGVISWPSTGRIWNVQYDRNEPPYPTGEEWFTAADADDA